MNRGAFFYALFRNNSLSGLAKHAKIIVKTAPKGCQRAFSLAFRGKICTFAPSFTQLQLFMKELIDQINAAYEAFAKDANAQAEGGNKAAGARARKASLEIEKAMKAFRKVSLEATK